MQIIKKIDESKIRWIALQKQNGETISKIAETMNAPTLMVKKIGVRCRYTDSDKIVYPAPKKAREQSFLTQITFCRAGYQNKRSSWHHTYARNTQRQYRNKHPLQ